MGYALDNFLCVKFSVHWPVDCDSKNSKLSITTKKYNLQTVDTVSSDKENSVLLDVVVAALSDILDTVSSDVQ